MNPYTEKLLSAIADYEAKCGISPVSVLDALWYDYSCRNPIDDGRLRQAEKNLSPVFAELSPQASDRLFDQIVDLLNAYQRAAYLEGLCTGAHLLRELECFPAM